MSRVVYYGNFEPLHSTENEVRLALEACGHVVDARQEQDWDGWLRTIDADVVLWTRTRSLSAQVDEELRWEMLAGCRQRGIPTVGYHLDRWWGLKREHEVESDPWFRCSLLCTADGGHDNDWSRVGVAHFWMPPAVSEFECVPGSYRPELASDVAFVGSWDGYHDEWWPDRAKMLAHVESWYGDRFRRWPQPGRGAVRGPTLRHLYASARVIVGDSCLVPDGDGVPVERYWSDRIPETIGRGGLLVHPEVMGLPLALPVFTYPLGDMDALHDVVETLLRRPDDSLARHRQRCIDYVRAHDTYTHRMRTLWAVLGL